MYDVQLAGHSLIQPTGPGGVRDVVGPRPQVVQPPSGCIPYPPQYIFTKISLGFSDPRKRLSPRLYRRFASSGVLWDWKGNLTDFRPYDSILPLLLRDFDVAPLYRYALLFNDAGRIVLKRFLLLKPNCLYLRLGTLYQHYCARFKDSSGGLARNSL